MESNLIARDASDARVKAASLRLSAASKVLRYELSVNELAISATREYTDAAAQYLAAIEEHNALCRAPRAGVAA